MTVLLYKTEGNLAYQFNNVSPNGEAVKIKNGNYSVVCYNNDSEYVQWRDINNIKTINAYMRNGEIDENHTRSLNTGENLIIMPDSICGTLKNNISVDNQEGVNQVISLEPHYLIDVYTYTILTVENVQYINKIKATL